MSRQTTFDDVFVNTHNDNYDVDNVTDNFHVYIY